MRQIVQREERRGSAIVLVIRGGMTDPKVTVTLSRITVVVILVTNMQQ